MKKCLILTMWLPISTFFDHWPIRMLGLLPFLYWITPFCTVLLKNFIFRSQPKWSNFPVCCRDTKGIKCKQLKKPKCQLKITKNITNPTDQSMLRRQNKRSGIWYITFLLKKTGNSILNNGNSTNLYTATVLSVCHEILGCLRLTLFRNKNTV